MEKVEQISEKPSWEQLGSLAGFIVEFLASILNFTQVEYWLSHKSELKTRLRESFLITDEFSEVRGCWENFYKSVFNWDVNFGLVIIPPEPTEGEWRLLFIPRGMSVARACSICNRAFPLVFTAGHPTVMPGQNARNTNSNYAIWVRAGIESDPEFFGKSTLEYDPGMTIGITVLERIIFELKYFIETDGKHLDLEGATFCSGSRDLKGDVPEVQFKDGTVRIYSRLIHGHGCGMGIRRVVAN